MKIHKAFHNKIVMIPQEMTTYVETLLGKEITIGDDEGAAKIGRHCPRSPRTDDTLSTHSPASIMESPINDQSSTKSRSPSVLSVSSVVNPFAP
jgi:hypothetical protein